ncbi:MAG: septation protein IspZ [Gammaproteobacteria bacterium]
MKLWTYRFKFALDGEIYRAEAAVSFKTIASRVFRDRELLAHDFTDVMQPEGWRNHQLSFTLADGRQLKIELGYIDWFRIGISVRLDEVLIHESHPGRVIRFPTVGNKTPAEWEAEHQRNKAEMAQASEQFSRNKYSIGVDIGIGALFFILVKLTDDLPLSALVTAGAGLAVVVAQRFVKVDLLGGLAIFGIVMLLISAGFSWVFQDDWAVKMKSTILGVLVATITLGDAFFNKGQYFGVRLLRYMMQPMDPQRLALGLGVLGLVMAGVNWVFAEYTSRDTWLYYTSFGDFLLTVVLILAVMRYARTDR